jgi:hypothetical protein
MYTAKNFASKGIYQPKNLTERDITSQKFKILGIFDGLPRNCLI